MRFSQRLQDEQTFVQAQCPGVICSRCGATLDTYADVCSADLDDACPGFTKIDDAKLEFNRKYDAKSRATERGGEKETG